MKANGKRDGRLSHLVSKFVLNFLLLQSTVDLFATACLPISLGVGGGEEGLPIRFRKKEG